MTNRYAKLYASGLKLRKVHRFGAAWGWQLYKIVACLLSIVPSITALHAEPELPGYHVLHYNSTNGLANTIKGALQDEHGFIWLATESGLTRFDGQGFKTINKATNGDAILRIEGIQRSPAGKIYIRSEKGMYYYVSDTQTLVPVQPTALFSDPGKLYRSMNFANRVARDLDRKYAAHLLEDWAKPDMARIIDHSLNSMVYASGTFYYFNEQDELIATDTTFSTFHKMIVSGLRMHDKPRALRSTVPAASITQNGSDIFLKQDSIIYELTVSANPYVIKAKALLSIGNVANVVGFIPMPNGEGFIVATRTDGIFIFQKQSFQTLTFNNPEINVFYAQAPYGPDGSLTANGLLSPAGERSLPLNFPQQSILKTTSGNYYVNMRQGQQRLVAKLNNKLEVVSEIPVSETKRPVCRFWQFEDGRIWISNDSAYLGQIIDDRVLWFKRPVGLPAKFFIADMVGAGQDECWIGGASGLARVNLQTGDVFIVPELEGVNVRRLVKDSSGVLWIGTYGDGFYAWHNNQLTRFPLDPEAYLLYAHNFMPDKSGRFWITTNHGLFTVKLDDLHQYLANKNFVPYYYYFDYTAGFNTNEFNGGCLPPGIVLGNGKFSLPSLNGLVQFYPDSIYPVFPTASIFVDKVIADTANIPLVHATHVIPAKTDRLLFYISSPYFGNAYNQHIEYRLSKSDDKWFPLNSNNIIELNNPAKGDHVIYLRKQSGFGQHYINQQIRFTVQPAFYDTTLFRLCLLLVAASLLYLLYRLRVRFLLQQKRNLQTQVMEKTREQVILIRDLETAVRELEHSQADLHKTIQFKEVLTMVITHDLQSPLRFLSKAMLRLNEKNKNAEPDVAELSHELQNASANIHGFVEDFSVWITKMNDTTQAKMEAVNLYALVQELVTFFGALQKERHNKISFEVSPVVAVWSDYQLLKIILRNVIDNANKHTHHGSIHICVCVHQEMVSIRISDTGAGMQPEMLHQLVHFTQQDHSFDYRNTGRPGNGYGYRLVTDFCALLNIQIKIESSPGKGTTVKFSGLTLYAENYTENLSFKNFDHVD